MKKIEFLLTAIALVFCFPLLSQHETAIKFFSSVPSLISSYPEPGNPCGNSVEFIINNYDEKRVTLKAENITKEKGKSKIDVSQKGNKTTWYKLYFNTDCDLSFRIYSDRPEDIYHYFVYRQDESADFCQRLSKKTVVPIRANMLQDKQGHIGTGITDGIRVNYRDTSDAYVQRVLFHTPFLDGIKGKAGDTYYINVYHRGENDAVHYMVLSACYREIALKTENQNALNKAQIIEKLPEHVTKPAENTKASESDSLLGAKEKELKEAKRIADEKAIAEAETKRKAEQEASEKAKNDELARKKAEQEKLKAQELAKKQAAEKALADAKIKKENEEKARSEAAAKAKAEAAEKKIAEAKAKQEAAEKKIAETKARQEAAEALKRKSSTKKLNPQLAGLEETDTLNQYIIEGEVLYSDPPEALVQSEIYISNSSGPQPIAKKMYSNEKGLFRFVNIPTSNTYSIYLNANDQELKKDKEVILKGKLSLGGKPAEGILINNKVKTAADGSFTLNSKDLFAVNINDHFDRWTVDLGNSAVYSDVLQKVGSVSLEGLVYKVQIGAYKNEKNFDYSFMSDLGKVELQALPDSITRFVMGEFSTLKEADAFKQKAIERKIKDAFILAYFNGNKKYLEELIEKKMLEKK